MDIFKEQIESDIVKCTTSGNEMNKWERSPEGCPYCDGTGYTDDGRRCEDCHGTGYNL